MVCNGKRKSTGNLVFRFKGDSFDKYETKSMKGKNQKNRIPIYKVDINDNILKEYSSIAECAEKENINKSTLESYLQLDKYDSRGKRRICKG